MACYRKVAILALQDFHLLFVLRFAELDPDFAVVAVDPVRLLVVPVLVVAGQLVVDLDFAADPGSVDLVLHLLAVLADRSVICAVRARRLQPLP